MSRRQLHHPPRASSSTLSFEGYPGYVQGYYAPLAKSDTGIASPPGYVPGSYFPRVDREYGNAFMRNLFVPNSFVSNPVPNSPPLSPTLPPAPFNSTDNINKKVSSVLNCTIGMMLWNEGLKFFPRTFSLHGEASLQKYVTLTLFSHLIGPLMMCVRFLYNFLKKKADYFFSIIDDWRPWYLQHLQQTFPSFPVRTLLSFNNHGVSSMLPLVNDNQGTSHANMILGLDE